MPGYTHLQRAQPVYLSHHLLAYVWMLARDRERFALVEAADRRLPLGAGALAGVNFDTDRAPSPTSSASPASPRTRSTPSPTATSCSTTWRPRRPARRTSRRLGAEIVLWSSAEFGFAEVLRRVGVGLLDHAAEEEPRRGRAAAREGAARSPATSSRCRA